jgi:DNA-binding response OmpR family regulator
MSFDIEKKTILVVDDEPFIQRSLKINLEMEGFHVITASDGLEALKVVSEKKPDLILLDIMMPNMDGYEFARKLREDPNMQKVYIIALTARGQQKDKSRSIQLGIDEHIPKPFQTGKLIERIKSVLGVSPET